MSLKFKTKKSRYFYSTNRKILLKISFFSDRNTVRFRGIPDAVTPNMLFSSLQPLFFIRKMGRPLKKRGSQKTN
jgi:hypothetical protein